MKEIFSMFRLTNLPKAVCYGSLFLSSFVLLSSFFLLYGFIRHWTVAFFCGVTIFLLGLLFEQLAYKKKIEKFLVQPLCWKVSCCGGLLILFLSTLYCGMRQFGGWDFSILVDSAWKFYQGEVPYKDFVCTTPPGFLIGGMLAFKFFGARWFSLVLAAAIYGGLTFLWSCWLLKKLTESRLVALLLACLLQACTTVLISFWWFNSITTIAGVLFFLSAILLFSSRDLISAWLSYLGSLILLSLMKPNTAGIEIVGITAVLFFSFLNKERIKLILISTVAFVGSVTILSLFNIHVTNLLSSYASIAHRAFTLKQFIYNNLFQMDVFERSLMIAVWLIFIFWIVVLLINAVRFFTPQTALGLVAITTGIFATVNNCEIALVNLQLILFGVWIFMEDAKKSERGFFAQGESFFAKNDLLFTLLCFFLVGLSFGEAVMRSRVKGVGDFFQYTTSREVIAGDFFEGLCASPFFVELHRELAATLPFYIERKDSIWFGPRLGWAYADFDLPSPADQPVAWEREVFYAPQQEPYLIRSWIEKKFEVLVFLKNDFTYLPIELLQFISNNYFLVQQQRAIMIFHRKK